MKNRMHLLAALVVILLPTMLICDTGNQRNATGNRNNVIADDSVKSNVDFQRSSPSDSGALSRMSYGSVFATDEISAEQQPRPSRRTIQFKKICWLPFDRKSFS
jgi:hypothetical protein